MRAGGVLLVLAGSPALAGTDAELLAFMGGQGCTIGADSLAAAEVAGFPAAQMNALGVRALMEGKASQQRGYVVLGEDICTIRLPDITSNLSVTSPEIMAEILPVDHYAAEGDPGCFLYDPSRVFDTRKGGMPGAGLAEYLDFLAAGVITGDLRFYSPSSLVVPRGFQVLAGECASVPNIGDIRRSHGVIAAGFGAYVRQKAAETPCDDDFAQGGQKLAILQQGGDPEAELSAEPANPPYNAWLWFEYDLIAMTAGWREGMGAKEKGEWRPPMCHYH